MPPSNCTNYRPALNTLWLYSAGVKGCPGDGWWWWSYCKLMLIFTSSSPCTDSDTLIAGNNLLHWESLCPRHLTLIEKPLLHCNCNYRLLWPVIYRNWRIISLNSIFVQLTISLYNPTLLLENPPLCGVYKKFGTIFMFGIVCNTRTENKLLELP